MLNESHIIDVSFRELSNDIKGTRFSNHSIHSYPAQLIPQIPHYFLKKYSNNNNNLVLDPFCGSGTVLVEAMHNGWDSIGIEINPIASLIAKVKSTPLEISNLNNYIEKIEKRYKTDNDNIKIPDFYNIGYWFDDDAIYNLKKLKDIINIIEDDDIRNFFLITFSSIIKAISKADPRIYVPVLPNKNYEKRVYDVWNIFYNTALYNIKKMNEFINMCEKPFHSSLVINEDIIKINNYADEIDAIITSPPYISAQKYMRSTRLEAYWLGYNKEEQLEINKNTIGTERILKNDYNKISDIGIYELDNLIEEIHEKNQKRGGIVYKYFKNMKEIINKLYIFLRDGGKFILVIGNNTVTGKKVQTNKYLSEISINAGFKINSIMRDTIISRKLMTKRHSTADIINYEWVIEMEK